MNSISPKNGVYRFVEARKFAAHLEKSGYSENYVYRTVGYVQSALVSGILKELKLESSIFAVTKVTDVERVYLRVRESLQDSHNHRVYSVAMHRYLLYIKTDDTK